MDGERLDAVRTYYRSIDEEEYDALEALLAPEFVHERPDRLLEGRERFVRFMREDRPRTEVTHTVDATYRGDGEVAARGRLVDDDEVLFGFVDVFSFEDGSLARLRTYTR